MMRQQTYFRTVADGKEIAFKETLGHVLFLGLGYAIGYGCFLIAILNLLFARPLEIVSLLASLAWIAIIATLTISECRKSGVRQHLVEVLGSLVRNRFAEFASGNSGEPILGFGHKLGSTRHYSLKLRPGGITAVDWGPGQGNIAGRENDWHVAMWFDVGSIVFDRSHASFGITIVGPSGRKATQEAFGAAFIEFLKANGVQLVLPPRELLGQVAEVVESFYPCGVRVGIGHEEYDARLLKWRMNEKVSRVTVVEIRGTTLYVRAYPPTTFDST
jgi:hypothetical protein